MNRPCNHYSASFKQEILEDYFRSGMSQQSCASKWGIPFTTLNRWLRVCKKSGEGVSLRAKSSHSMDAKDQVIERQRLEIERLRRESEYQRLRAQAYERLIEIVRLEDGIDLLKKDGAKQ